jgi:hypothetical protein
MSNRNKAKPSKTRQQVTKNLETVIQTAFEEPVTHRITPEATQKSPSLGSKLLSNARELYRPRASYTKRLRQLARSKIFCRFFTVFSLTVLILSTIFWATLGASLQRFNADQLVDSYLFNDLATFNNATFPGAHTFLLKWPLFILVKLLGYSQLSFICVTVFMALITVLALVFIVRKIERRPLVFGAICLALASILLLIPAEPYPGALLPVNMAMTTTRNLEYVLYIACLYFFIKPKALSHKNISLWLALAGLTILIASDKLFAALAIGSGVLATIIFLFTKKKELAKISLRWLFGGLVSVLLANMLLWAINVTGLTHISQGENVSPFAFIHDIKSLMMGVTFGITSLLTNFGANPVHDTVIAFDLPSKLLLQLTQPTILAYIFNFILFCGGVTAAYKITCKTIVHKRQKEDSWEKLAIFMILSAVTSLGAYILTDHYFPVDARYLAITLFTLVIATAVFTRSQRLKLNPIWAVITIAMLLLPLSVVNAYNSHMSSLSAYSERDTQNHMIAQVLKQRKSTVLVGDYWLATPIGAYFDSPDQITILPLSSCTSPREVLSSKTWQPDLRNRAFTYLAHRTPGPAGTYNGCKLDEITAVYGRPDESKVISGSPKDPTEMLLFYNNGTTRAKANPSSAHTGTTLPVNLNQIASVFCPTKTIMNIIAHQDDDILFINPDTYRSIKDGGCIRTVYVTAGDGGFNNQYWYGRELGARAAYARMSGEDNQWSQKTVIVNNRYLSIASLKNNPKISLIFMHLPDGNMHGNGFRSHAFESLTALQKEKTNSVRTIDGSSTYSKAELIDTIKGLMNLYSPSEIRTQETQTDSSTSDHSDHMAVGYFSEQAFIGYYNKDSTTLKFYSGYTIRQLDANLTEEEAALKEDWFRAYAEFDQAVCQTHEQCQNDPVYDSYLKRQYSTVFAAPNIP